MVSLIYQQIAVAAVIPNEFSYGYVANFLKHMPGVVGNKLLQKALTIRESFMKNEDRIVHASRGQMKNITAHFQQKIYFYFLENRLDDK